MLERDLIELPPGQVLSMLKAQVDAAVGMHDAGLVRGQNPGAKHCSERRILNFEIGDFRITARFTEPHD